MRLKGLPIRLAVTAITLSLVLGACASSSNTNATPKGRASAQVSKVFCLLEKKNSQDTRAAVLSKAIGDLLAKPENKGAVKSVNISVDKAEQIAGKLRENSCANVLSLEPNFSGEVLKVAKNHPDINFAVMAAEGQQKLANVRGIDFDLRQPAFLAGYAAAAVTKSGQIGAVSSVNNADANQGTDNSVSENADKTWANAFRLGAEYYNQFKGSGVKLSAWDNNAGGPLQVESAKLHEQLLKLAEQKIDVILVIAPIGESASLEGLAGKDALAIWNGQDAAANSAQVKSSVFTSTVIDASGCAKELFEQAKTGWIASKDYVGTLKNSGVKLAGFGDYAPLISDSLSAELAGIRSQIDNGKIDIAKLAAHQG